MARHSTKLTPPLSWHSCLNKTRRRSAVGDRAEVGHQRRVDDAGRRTRLAFCGAASSGVESPPLSQLAGAGALAGHRSRWPVRSGVDEETVWGSGALLLGELDEFGRVG